MVLGIDFGTCNFSAALMIDNQIRLVKEPVKQGYSFPSSIYLTEEGEILVGQIAENRKFLDITRYRREFKRDLLQNNPYLLGSQGEYQFTPQELIIEVIKNLKKEADKITTSLGKENTTKAVVDNNNIDIKKNIQNRNRKVFLKDFSIKVTKKDIQTVFAEYGTVEQVQLFTCNGYTRSEYDYALIQMKTEEEAIVAAETLDGAEWMGRTLIVQTASNIWEYK